MPSSQSTVSRSSKSTRTDWSYTLVESRYGLFTSVLSDGTQMVTGLTEDAVRLVTDDIHIPVMKGEYDGFTSKPRSSVVDGKL